MLSKNKSNKNQGNGTATLWESKEFFERFVRMTPKEQEEARQTKDFERAKNQYCLWDYQYRKSFYEKEGLFNKLEELNI